MDVGFGSGDKSNIFQIYDYVRDRWPKNPFHYKFPNVNENEQQYMGSEAIEMIPYRNCHPDFENDRAKIIIFPFKKYVYFYSKKYNYSN
jgi:hypothetical protein